ncbi:MAG: TrmB family transcriptional regulator [Pirellulaceae bacterium]
MSEQIESLVELGFTRLEAQIYAFLIREPAASGYRVAQAISRPAANTYKALESLEAKGAVLVDDDEVRRFRAVPVAELLNRLERKFRENRRRAQKALTTRKKTAGDDRIYQLRTRDQVLERAHMMLSESQDIVLVDAVPQVLEIVLPSVEAAIKRGVVVIVKGYQPIEIAGARVIVRPHGKEITHRLPGELLSLNVDGTQHLLALLRQEGDSVFQAIWPGSPVVAYILYTGLVNEISLTSVMTELAGRATIKSIRTSVADLRQFHPISSQGPVYKRLLNYLGVDAADTGTDRVATTAARAKQTTCTKKTGRSSKKTKTG